MSEAGGLVGAFGQIGITEQQAQAARYQGDFARMQAEANKQVAEIQAEDALARGDEDVARFKDQINQLLGKQRASIAASGVELGTGSAFDIQEDTMRRADLDALTIKNNAHREAWGYKVQASNYGMSGRINQTAAGFKADQILTAGYNTAINNAVGDAKDVATMGTGG